jgi:glycolate oxidase iron-sulfur subunit
MTSVAPAAPPKPLVVSAEHSSDAKIDYELFLDCVHCGLCTSACPTYLELGTEADSPRGRIYLMRAVTDGRLDLNPEVRRHLDLCLDCRACESACPSGVQYSKLIEPFRIQMARDGIPTHGTSLLERLMLFHATPYPARMRLLLAPARWLQKLGLDRWMERIGLPHLLPRSLRQMQEMLPGLKAHYGRLPEILRPEGPRRARVALFIGCAGDAFFPETTLNTARVLQKNGCEVWIPRNQVCCGALHYHGARPDAAQQLALTNIDAFCGAANSLDAVIVNAAGCGAMLKEYCHLFHEEGAVKDAEKLAANVRDISEFLVDLGPVKPQHPVPVEAAYHDACHLCHGQQIRRQPRQLLEMIPELKLLPLNETEVCCGAAGSYNLTEPEMAERLGQRKVDNILQADVQAVFAGNVGCLLQIGRYLRRHQSPVWVAHPIDALWASYSGELPEPLTNKR